MKEKLPVAAFFLLVLGNCFGQEIENPLTAQSVRAKVAISGQGNLSGDLHGGTASLEIVSFKESENQSVLTISETLYMNGKTIQATTKEDEFGNRYAVFELDGTGSFEYEIRAVIETDSKLEGIQEEDLSQGISEFHEFTEPTKNVESNREEIRTLALNKFESKSFVETLRDIIEWTHQYIEYDLSYYPETYSAIETLNSKKGVCDEFAVLSAAMFRAKEIPTKFSLGVVYSGNSWGNHAWIQTYTPKNGWIESDSTYGEAGYIDGMHFLRAAFPDPESNKSKLTVKSVNPNDFTSTVTENEPQVEIQNIERFSGILKASPKDITFPANQWFDLRVEIENLTDKTAISPVSLQRVENLHIEEREKILVFGPKEEKNVEWKIRMDQQLSQNQRLEGKYKVITLSGEEEANLKIVAGNSENTEGNVLVEEVLPIIQGPDLVIEITLKNLGSSPAQAAISLENGVETQKSVEIRPLSQVQSTISIKNHDNGPFYLKITGEGTNYEKTIEIKEGQPIVKDTPGQESPFRIPGPESIFNQENAIIAAILFGTVTVGLLLKALLSK